MVWSMKPIHCLPRSAPPASGSSPLKPNAFLASRGEASHSASATRTRRSSSLSANFGRIENDEDIEVIGSRRATPGKGLKYLFCARFDRLVRPQCGIGILATEALWWVALQARSNWKWARPAASPDNLLDKGGGDSTWKFTQDELHAVPDKLKSVRTGLKATAPTD
ncbi:hypothetical protein AO1008_04504 [Aspergillus oryzae 100-8]|uniref:Uncharacterized protein n=1 Tax=Aspergillus oryzae (strain 3.042) TaxID=1160506 RepID=I8TH34_ASPO3|nr:hypothetical protein Ao3042_10649 [Aspergillus oryzae 3.042]KDE78189.1 hypothetical protein AO1008_04504 [Aspergillus oryzae 100-8]|eukprot:EIT73355.1 hypothetical protein Ao3042_10649 [Aspergillus oryzae 3.042]